MAIAGGQQLSEDNEMTLLSFKELLKGKSLLIVEDEDIQREYMCDEIAAYISCDGASSYEEATRILAEKPYDFLLSDIHLTRSADDKSEGLKVMSFAKEKFPDITVIGMSTDNTVPKIDAMDHFATKPLMGADAIMEALFTGFKGNHES